MEDREESWFYLSGGSLAAVVLGMALVPLRSFTTASNWTFVFLILTIGVAEFGGRWAAVATALCSALSLDFFLTEPYLRLSIADKHDVIAFAGLMFCGLSVAALGSTRARQIADLEGRRGSIGTCSTRPWASSTGPGPAEAQLTRMLNTTRAVLPLAALAVRDGSGQVVAGTAGAPSRSVPELILQPDLLLPGTPRVVGRRGRPASRRGSAAGPRRRPPAGGLARSVGRWRPREHGVAADPRGRSASGGGAPPSGRHRASSLKSARRSSSTTPGRSSLDRES